MTPLQNTKFDSLKKAQFSSTLQIQKQKHKSSLSTGKALKEPNYRSHVNCEDATPIMNQRFLEKVMPLTLSNDVAEIESKIAS